MIQNKDWHGSPYSSWEKITFILGLFYGLVIGIVATVVLCSR